jgi:hypothetical protein
MLVFRSEAHLDRWLAGRARGMAIPITKVAELAEAWWWDRLSPAWQPRSREESQAILDRLGLTGEFWRLG